MCSHEQPPGTQLPNPSGALKQTGAGHHAMHVACELRSPNPRAQPPPSHTSRACQPHPALVWLPALHPTHHLNPPKLAQTQTDSLSPRQGRNVVLESKFGSPKIVNDGVTIAREVELEDPVENIGAKLVRQVGVWVRAWSPWVSARGG